MIRAYNSKNEYSKWSPSFFRSTTSLKKYDIILSYEDEKTYCIVAKLKDSFSNTTILENAKQIGTDDDVNQVKLRASNILDFNFKIVESVRYTIEKSNFAITKIEYKSHIPLPKSVVRNDYEIGYKSRGNKYYFDYAKTWTPLGKIGFRSPMIYVYAELKVTTHLTEIELKDTEKKTLDRKIEIHDLPETISDKNTIPKFTPLKPYF